MPSYLTLSWSSIQRHTPPKLTPSWTLSLDSLPPRLKLSKTPSPFPLSPRYIRSLTYFLTVSLTPRLPPSLTNCFPSTRNVFSTHSQTSSLPPRLILTQNPSVPPSKTHPPRLNHPSKIYSLPDSFTLSDSLPNMCLIPASLRYSLLPSQNRYLPHSLLAGPPFSLPPGLTPFHTDSLL